MNSRDTQLQAQAGISPSSGSYFADEVEFLLTPLARQQLQQADDLQEKEKLIQSGQKHYSEMLSLETTPKASYQSLYQQAFAQNLPQLAADCLRLAQLISASRSGPICLVSLMRAGTPIGVILKHLLQRLFKREVRHFSVSILRQRGLDLNALQHILAQGCAPQSLVFVDGWTSKGGIAQQLHHSITQFEAEQSLGVRPKIDSGMYVLSDLAGVAKCSASHQDYLIPSAILNATVSGLVSRSILNQSIESGQFHGCIFYPELAEVDMSRQFVDQVVAAACQLANTDSDVQNAENVENADGLSPSQADQYQQQEQQEQQRTLAAHTMQEFLAHCQQSYGITDQSLIKPGIGEASRALLRRAPRQLLLRDASAPEVAHLLALAEEKQVTLKHVPSLPYLAVALIDNALEN